jgi:hypothetical protein
VKRSEVALWKICSKNDQLVLGDLKFNIAWTLEVSMDKIALDALHPPSQGGIRGNKIRVRLGCKYNMVESVETIGRVLNKSKVHTKKIDIFKTLFAVHS